jgi:hypothetical protein
MCGGVGFKIKNISDQELKKYYSPELIKRFRASDRLESFFWYKDAVLPIKTKEGTQLKLWGNKDAKIKLPQTGWAKEESLQAGKWDYLHPEPVVIPVDSGYEKKTWFDFLSGTKGILVKHGPEERVYMITAAASAEYKKATGHDREPPGEKSNYEHALRADKI